MAIAVPLEMVFSYVHNAGYRFRRDGAEVALGVCAQVGVENPAANADRLAIDWSRLENAQSVNKSSGRFEVGTFKLPLAANDCLTQQAV